jgi:hypothetical protein
VLVFLDGIAGGAWGHGGMIAEPLVLMKGQEARVWWLYV